MTTISKGLTYILVAIVAIYANHFAITWCEANVPIRSYQCGWYYGQPKTSSTDNVLQDCQIERSKSRLLPVEHDSQLKACLKHYGNEIAQRFDSDICYDGLGVWVVYPARPHISNDDNIHVGQRPDEELQVDLGFCLDYLTNLTIAYGTREHSFRSGKKARPQLTSLEAELDVIGPCYCADQQDTPASRIVFKGHERAVEYMAGVIESSMWQLPRWKAMGAGTEADTARRDSLVRLLEMFDARARTEDALRRLSEAR